MILLGVASLGILVASAGLAVRLPPRGLIMFLIAFALGAWSMVLLSVGFAGLILRDLSATTLLAIGLAWPVGVAIGHAVRPPGPLHLRDRLAASARMAWSAAKWLPATLALVMIAVTLVWRTFLALRLPMIDYDGWSYHLVTVDVWLQANALVQASQRIWSDGNPSNGEILTTWLVAFDRRDAMASLTSLLPIPVVIVATAGLARRFGASRRTALLCCLLFGATPALIALAGTSYVDASSAAAVISTWNLGLRFLGGERDKPTTLMLALAAGIAAGTKFNGFLLVGPMLLAVGLVLLAGLIDAWREKSPVRPWLTSLALLVLPVVLLGATWYLKNILLHGNPLYPVGFGPFPGPTTFAGMTIDVPQIDRLDPVSKVLASWAWDWKLLSYSYAQRPGGFGRAWLLVIPLAIVGLSLLIRNRRWAAVGLIVVPAVVTLAIMPENWYARLTLFVPGVALALTALALDAIRPRLRTITATALVLVAAISLILANITPNVYIRGTDIGGGSGRVTPGEYLRLLLEPSDEARGTIGLRRVCAGFGVIPPGSRVAHGGFNLLHGVVGPNIDRILTTPLPEVADAASLAAAMRQLDARWLVTGSSGTLPELATSAPGLFRWRGDVCAGARLWELTEGP